jgi:hypothetical protein
MKRMSKWLHAIHSHCAATKTEDNPDGEGFTVEEAVARFGDPVSRSTPRNILRLAALDGHFRSVRIRVPLPSVRGRWFKAKYFAVGETPPLKREPVARRHKSQFDGIKKASSIFDLAQKINEEERNET